MTDKNEALAVTLEQIKQLQEQLHAHTGRAIAERDKRDELELTIREMERKNRELEDQIKSADK